MALSVLAPEFIVKRDPDLCIECGVCSRQCSFDTHSIDPEDGTISSDAKRCCGCQRCASLCPTGALTIIERELTGRSHPNWTIGAQRSIARQAETGGMLLTGMGSDKPYKNIWDHLVLNASQVTNPSIDPLREPMELRTYLGAKPNRVEFDDDGNLLSAIGPLLELNVPIMFSAMSYGSISLNACKSLAGAAAQSGTYFNTGEGGLHRDLYQYSDRAIVQVASGRFGVNPDYLAHSAAVEIKIGQGAKPGIGGHLPGEKVTQDISETRMIPMGADAISPAPHHDIYSIEDLKQLIYALKEATNYTKPISVKIAAVNNVIPIASGCVRAGADIVAIDGVRGGSGATPTVIRDNVGIPIEFAIAAVDSQLRKENIRNQASIVAAGGFRNSADIMKAIALGADAVYIGTSALIALGCHMCQKCYTGKCTWGIATQDPYLTKRLNPEIGTRRAANLLRAWGLEMKEMLGGMGMDSIDSLRGNREMLRGIGLTKEEMDILDVAPAGM
ncbi:MAG: IMP dehydrogenase [Armatimonadetes bacterium]|nr:IMP dehydrogenase [Armatimonadota bacterium]MDI9586621.1 glutamate synthase-related protein [Acidobacteriota bacterium]